MMKRLWIGVLALAAAGTARAQEPIINAKLAESQPEKFQVAFCNLKPDGKVKKGVDALKKAHEPKEDRAEKLAEAKTQILEGLAEKPADAAGWYYLGRVYLMQGDVGGVDSVFDKALELEESCEIDINQQRQNSWAALANAGLELQRGGDVEGAITMFRDASRLFDQLPHVVANMGVLFANSSRDDSAAVYFKQAMDIATMAAESDSSLISDRNNNALNLALMYQRLGKHAEAIPVLQQYLVWDPSNLDARKALAQSFRGAGMADSADALDNAMVQELAKQDLDSLDTSDIMNIGVAAFNGKQYPQAAEAFAKVVSRNPFNRDAVYNLANAYLAIGTDNKALADSLAGKDDAKAAQLKKAADDGFTKLIEAGTQLEKIEPMNEDVYRLLGQAHRGLGQTEEVLKAAEKLVGLPVNIEMQSFQPGRNSAKLIGTATGRTPMDASGTELEKKPFGLVVEFVDASGQIIDMKEVQIPAVETGAPHEITVEGKGANITAWRYHKKS